MEQYQFYLGVDWGTQTHELCLRGRHQDQPRRQRFSHNAHSLAQMLDWIGRHVGGRWRALAVAIERPHGILVQLLLARQAAVFAINPKQLDCFRGRYNVAGAKDDRLDALVLADTLQKDPFAYHRVAIPPPPQLLLRELTHTLQDVRADWRRQCNRLWDQLVRYYPGLLTVAGGADEPWLWKLLELAPTPAQGVALPLEALGALLRRHRIRRISPEQLQECLAQSVLALAEDYVAIQAERTQTLLGVIGSLHQEVGHLEARITTTLEEIARAETALRDGAAAQLSAATDPPPGGAAPSPPPTDFEIIGSLGGIGPKTLAAIYSEAIQPLRQGNYHQIRALAGAAAVTKRSGKMCSVQMRYACNGLLRQALHHAANIAWRQVPYWGVMYREMRARGQTHGRALRGLGDRMLKVLVSMLRHRTLFDPERLGRIHTGPRKT